jgi:hypothetical protein
VHPARPKTKRPESVTKNSERWCFIDPPGNRSVSPPIVRGGMWACVIFDLPARTPHPSARMRRSVCRLSYRDKVVAAALRLCLCRS